MVTRLHYYLDADTKIETFSVKLTLTIYLFVNQSKWWRNSWRAGAGKRPWIGGTRTRGKVTRQNWSDNQFPPVYNTSRCIIIPWALRSSVLAQTTLSSSFLPLNYFLFWWGSEFQLPCQFFHQPLSEPRESKSTPLWPLYKVVFIMIQLQDMSEEVS